MAFPLARYPAARRGFTLLEVMFAVGILAFASVATISGLLVASMQARQNTYSLAAQNVAQGQLERMIIDAFADINETNYPDTFTTSAAPIMLDTALQIPCDVVYEFDGFGTGTLSSSSLRDNDANWEANEWAGDRVYFVGGSGMAQFATIQSNTATNLSFSDSVALSAGATTGSTRYLINNGKTVTVTVRWEDIHRRREHTVQTVVSNFRGDDDLGF